MELETEIAIIGAGPSGLMAAEILGKAGKQVTIYDRMASPARKLLIAGRGGLNLTHSEPLDVFLTRYGKASEWLSPYINSFTPTDLRNWAESLGQQTFIGSSGRVFPKSMKAVELLRSWLKRLESLNINYAPRHNWLGWESEQLVFSDAHNNIVKVKAKATLLALGGASWPRLGSNGAWVDILNKEGISTTPLRPANSGFLVNWSSYFSQRFAGQPLKPVAVSHNGQTRQGEAMLTAKGIEGGVIYALSGQIREDIARNDETAILLDLRPAMDAEALAKKLANRKKGQSFSNFMKSAGFTPVVTSLLKETGHNSENPMELATILKNLPVKLTGTSGMERAISSAGGIALNELNNHLMLLKKPGVFASGEMLDWEAPTGGYLLQACYSTGVAAANGIVEYLR